MKYPLFAGFPNVIGCIDGTQVKIQAPSENEEEFLNRKGFHSINVQVSFQVENLLTESSNFSCVCFLCCLLYIHGKSWHFFSLAFVQWNRPCSLSCLHSKDGFLNLSQSSEKVCFNKEK